MPKIRMNVTRFARVVVTSFVFATLLGYGAAQAADKVSVRLSWFANGEEAFWAYGVKKGFFKAENIDLEIKEGSGSAKTLGLMGAGEDRFASANAYALAGLVAKGLPVTMIANLVPVIPSSILFFEGTAINGPKDLEGMSVAFTAGDINHTTFTALTKANGVDMAKVKDVYFDSRGKVAAFMAGKVDAVAGFYTFSVPTIEAKTGKKVKYLRYSDYGVNVLGSGLVINNKHLGERDLNCRFVRAVMKSRAEATKHPDEAIKALLEMYPKAGEFEAAKAIWVAISSMERSPHVAGKPLGYMADQEWDELLNILKTYGDTKAKILSHASYFTDDFVGCK